MPEILKLSSGAMHIRFPDDRDLGFRNKNCFVHLPPRFGRKTIPDKYIYEPERNRESVNRWWATYLKVANKADG